MKTQNLFYLFILVGLLVVSCQKDSPEPVDEIDQSTIEFIVPVIPDEIAALMSEEDVARFKAGPGEDYIRSLNAENARMKRGRWYPVLMKLGYNLQIGPFVGSCDNPLPCFGPTGLTGAPGCGNPENFRGAMGMTFADGYWFSQKVLSKYFPVFCFPDYAGYGEGFYALDNGMLWIEAQNSPFQYDADGNSRFYRKGHYNVEKSTGTFSGATGWEIMISYTAAENSPSSHPQGKGYSDVIIFGWVYY